MFRLEFTTEAAAQLRKLQKEKSLQKRCKAVLKALAYLENNPRHSA